VRALRALGPVSFRPWIRRRGRSGKVLAFLVVHKLGVGHAALVQSRLLLPELRLGALALGFLLRNPRTLLVLLGRPLAALGLLSMFADGLLPTAPQLAGPAGQPGPLTNARRHEEQAEQHQHYDNDDHHYRNGGHLPSLGPCLSWLPRVPTLLTASRSGFVAVGAGPQWGSTGGVTAVGQRRAGGGEESLAGRARRGTENAADSRGFRWSVRAGFLARGVTYALVGALALALAAGAGTGGTPASQQGALALLDQGWLGKLALIVIAVGLVAYALWKLIQGIFGHGPEGGGSDEVIDRVGNVAGGVAYIIFFALAIRILIDGGGGSSGGPKHEAAGVLGWPGGPVLVGIGGAVLIGVSAYQIYDAVTGGFAQEAKTGRMGTDQRRLYLTLGRIGLTARALVFALIGYFLVKTAIDYNSKSAVGVDGALARLHHQTFGPWLVGLVAAGLLAFAIFSMFEARFRRL
jgi:hypothetical protein